ncbi:hypothetical protein [Streptomyces sp. NPDC040750]|uniref:hypothetical protein n=1 Tax=Streptomyces sp. NPDC040750 TaxID=3154491 RepID=UPI0033E01B0C
MDLVALACVVLPVTALLYGLVGLRSRLGPGPRPKAGARAGSTGDPYRVAAGRWWAEDDIQAAAARLLLDGLATINHRGNLSLTTTGADPMHSAGHPLPDALLAALRRRTASTTLGSIALRDAAFHTAREEFHAGHRSGPNRRTTDGPGCLAATGALLLTGEIAFDVAALSDRLPQGPTQWTAAVATALAVAAQIGLLGRYGRRHDAAWPRDARTEPPPPAPLPPGSRRTVREGPGGRGPPARRAAAHQPPPQPRPRTAPRLDTPGRAHSRGVGAATARPIRPAPSQRQQGIPHRPPGIRVADLGPS